MLLSLPQRHWDVKDGRFFFQPQLEAAIGSVNAMEVITNSMTYARELERIV